MKKLLLLGITAVLFTFSSDSQKDKDDVLKNLDSKI